VNWWLADRIVNYKNDKLALGCQDNDLQFATLSNFFSVIVRCQQEEGFVHRLKDLLFWEFVHFVAL